MLWPACAAAARDNTGTHTIITAAIAISTTVVRTPSIAARTTSAHTLRRQPRRRTTRPKWARWIVTGTVYIVIVSWGARWRRPISVMAFHTYGRIGLSILAV